MEKEWLTPEIMSVMLKVFLLTSYSNMVYRAK